MKNFLISAALILCAAPAFSAPECAPAKDVNTGLLRNFGETVQASGLTNDGTLTEMYANLENGTWTVVVTLPSGMACLVASGESFELIGENS